MEMMHKRRKINAHRMVEEHVLGFVELHSMRTLNNMTWTCQSRYLTAESNEAGDVEVLRRLDETDKRAQFDSVSKFYKANKLFSRLLSQAPYAE